MELSAAVSVSTGADPALRRLIREAIARNGGWLPFDRFMALALYSPGLGYYANNRRWLARLNRRGGQHARL